MKHMCMLLGLAAVLTGTSANEHFAGAWELMEEASTPADPWRTLDLEISIEGDAITVIRIWTGSYNLQGTDTLRLVPGTGIQVEPMRVWLDNRHLGVRIPPNATREVVAEWKDVGRTLTVEQQTVVTTSQGDTPLRIYSEYRLSADGERLELLEFRSTRPRPVSYAFRRAHPDT